VERLIAAKVDLTRRDRSGRTAKVIAAQGNHADVVAALTAAGASEYAGKTLPDSVASAEVAGQEQQDVTGSAYEVLPCLPPRLRVFAVHPPRRTDEDRHQAAVLSARLYAVLPPDVAVRLARPEDFKKLGLSIKTPADALALARAIDTPQRLTGWGDLQILFTGVPFVEFPEGAVWIVRPPAAQFGIVSPKVEASPGGFKIVRYGLAGEGAFTARIEKSVQVLEVTETVSSDGTYTHAERPVATPGLSIRPAFHPR
jgi:hypothetical protein